MNLSVIGYYVRHRHEQRLNPLTYLVIPLIGAVVDVYLLTKLGSAALTLGVIWMLIGVGYLLALTRGLRVPPPELSLAE